jgi:hypothetical protein
MSLPLSRRICIRTAAVAQRIRSCCLYNGPQIAFPLRYQQRIIPEIDRSLLVGWILEWFLIGFRISWVPEIGGAFDGWEGLQDFGGRIGDGVRGTRACFSQEAFEFGEDLLDRVEVWRDLGRNEAGSDGPDRLSHGPLWEPRFVEDHDVAGPERREKELFDMGEESLAVDGSVEQARRLEAVVAHGGQEGRSFPAAVRNLVDGPLAAGRPTVKARHVGLGPGLVNEDQSSGIDAALISSPSRPMATYVRTVLLARDERLFSA